VTQAVQQVLEIRDYKKHIKKVTTAWEIEFISEEEPEQQGRRPVSAQQPQVIGETVNEDSRVDSESLSGHF